MMCTCGRGGADGEWGALVVSKEAKGRTGWVACGYSTNCRIISRSFHFSGDVHLRERGDVTGVSKEDTAGAGQGERRWFSYGM